MITSTARKRSAPPLRQEALRVACGGGKESQVAPIAAATADETGGV
jgi:hypothetical protein